MHSLSSNHFSVRGDKDNLKGKWSICCWGSIYDATSSFLRHAAIMYKSISNSSAFCKTKIGHLGSIHAILWVYIFLPTEEWHFFVSLWTKNIPSFLLVLSSNQKFSERKKRKSNETEFISIIKLEKRECGHIRIVEKPFESQVVQKKSCEKKDHNNHFWWTFGDITVCLLSSTFSKSARTCNKPGTL